MSSPRGFGLLQKVRATSPAQVACLGECVATGVTLPIRRHSSSAAAASLVEVPHRAILSLKGKDVFKLLQGLVSNDVSLLEKRFAGEKSASEKNDIVTATYAGLMTPQGRMVADLFLHLPTSSSSSSDPEILLEHDLRISSQVQAFVKRFKLRSKVKLTDVSSQWNVAQCLSGSPQLDPSQTILLRDGRSPEMGFRVLAQTAHDGGSRSIKAPEEYTIHRILQGVPEGSEDISHEHAMPLEVNLDYMGGVDFRKGCYVGQELTARTHHTGVVRKRIVPVVLFAPDAEPPTELKVNKDFDIALPPVAADVRSTAVAAAAQSSGEESAPTKSSGRGRSAGKFTAGIGNIGLACLRLEQVQRWVPPGRAGEGEDGLTLTVQNAQGETLGVKPFIPKWWPESPMHDT